MSIQDDLNKANQGEQKVSVWAHAHLFLAGIIIGLFVGAILGKVL